MQGGTQGESKNDEAQQRHQVSAHKARVGGEHQPAVPEQQKRQKGKFELVQNLRQQIVIKREIHLEQARKSYSRVKAA